LSHSASPQRRHFGGGDILSCALNHKKLIVPGLRQGRSEHSKQGGSTSMGLSNKCQNIFRQHMGLGVARAQEIGKEWS
jgi:hypothetical protein